MLEYRQTMNASLTRFDTGEWPAPITEDYTDELNDFDLRRLEALRTRHKGNDDGKHEYRNCGAGSTTISASNAIFNVQAWAS
jgi:hypothetical protein